MEEDGLLTKAQAIRDREHRLRPALRLKTLEDVVGFIHDKGLVSMLGGNELPSVISAVMGRPWKPTGKGFTSWLEWWNLKLSGKSTGYLLADLPRRRDILGTRIFRNTKTFVSNQLWPVLNPIVQHYHELASRHSILSQIEWKILDGLEQGPTRTDKLRTALKTQGKQRTAKFHKALSRLESHGLIVGYEDPKPEKHLHATIWHLWSQRTGLREKSGISYGEALNQLLERTVDACVLAPEKEVENWFSWNGQLAQAKEALVNRGRLVRAGSFLLMAKIGRSLESSHV